MDNIVGTKYTVNKSRSLLGEIYIKKEIYLIKQIYVKAQ